MISEVGNYDIIYTISYMISGVKYDIRCKSIILMKSYVISSTSQHIPRTVTCTKICQ